MGPRDSASVLVSRCPCHKPGRWHGTAGLCVGKEIQKSACFHLAADALGGRHRPQPDRQSRRQISRRSRAGSGGNLEADNHDSASVAHGLKTVDPPVQFPDGVTARTCFHRALGPRQRSSSGGGERPGRSLWRATGSEEARCFPNQFEALAASDSAARRPCLHGQGGSQMRNAPSDRYSRSCCTSAHPSASSPTERRLCVPGRRPAAGRLEGLWHLLVPSAGCARDLTNIVPRTSLAL
ncbi:hypothetical protein MTO96_018858 [Rhipicephalus appendiculatus]